MPKRFERLKATARALEDEIVICFGKRRTLTLSQGIHDETVFGDFTDQSTEKEL